MNKKTTLLSLVSLIAAGACGTNTVVPPPPPSVWQGWIAFDQPEENVRTGAGFALAGPIETTCHIVGRETLESGSMDSYVLSWDRRRQANLTLKIASLLGVGATAGRASSGRISFDTLFIRRATDVRPVPFCQDAAADGLPKLPVIVSLLGAKRFRYELTDEQGRSLNAEAAREIKTRIGTLGGTASVTDSMGSEFSISFSTPRFIAAQFQGFQQGRADSVFTAPTKFGHFAEVPEWGWQVRADTGGLDAIRLIVDRTSPPARRDTVRSLSDKEQFSFGRDAREGASGAFLTGTLFVGPDGSEYMVMVRRRNITTWSWATSAHRDSLLAWVRSRQ